MSPRLNTWLRSSTLFAAALCGAALFASPARAATTNYLVPATGVSTVWFSDQQVLAVSQARTDPGAPIIQWDDTGGDEQRWYFDEAHDRFGNFLAYLLRNKNSNLCLGYDGTPGDQLFQEPCDVGDLNQYYDFAPGPHLAHLVSGDVIDIWGASDWRGAPIDLWPDNGQWNQEVYVVTVY